MTAILGISAFYHDSAAAILVDGKIVAAAQEERFTRIKHDASFPVHAVQYCLGEAGIGPESLTHIGYYEKPLLKFDRLLETYQAFAPRGFRSFAQAIPSWLTQKLHLAREIRRGLQAGQNLPSGHGESVDQREPAGHEEPTGRGKRGRYRRRIVFTEHHESHAASAFFPSPFDEAAILTIDGVGEWATTCIGWGRGNRIELTDQLRFPHSLGLLYSAFTYFCGFQVNSGEYKLMGLAPYGTPRFVDRILEHLIDLKDDGSFRLNMRYFNYGHGLTMTSREFERLFGSAPRRGDAPLAELHADLAASIQRVTEMIVMRMAEHVHAKTGLDNLCLAGGVALNCVANGKVLRDGPFKQIWVQPAAGDAGGALGVALYIWHQLLDKPRAAEPTDSQSGSLLGQQFSPDDIATRLKACGAVFHCVNDQQQLVAEVAKYLAAGDVVGWMQGRMEFGPRALGNRSILGDPRSASMQTVLNRKVKNRESFRPFAPAILAEQKQAYFDIAVEHDSPYMLIVCDVQASQRVVSAPCRARTGLDRVHDVRSRIPAVTHIDHSARVQTVDPIRNATFTALLKAFEQRTGCPLLINTSLNVDGEPIVCTPEDAFRCFQATEMDALVVGNCVLLKSEQAR